MIKIHILVRCEHCQGKAYLPTGQATSHSGDTYTRYKPCSACQGSGNQAKWVNLQEFLEMLSYEAAKDLMEPGLLELARNMPISQYQDSRGAVVPPENPQSYARSLRSFLLVRQMHRRVFAANTRASNPSPAV